MTQQQVSTLRSVFAERLLSVPDYQRPFAWHRKQLEDLWEDLDLVGHGVHYTGTLVLRDRVDSAGAALLAMDEDGVTLRETEVVDGQQRLTSCVVLLDRVRRRLDALTASEVEGAAEVAAMLARQFCWVRVNEARRPKLQLAKELREYWQDVMLGDITWPTAPLTAGQQRLARAAEFFDAKLGELRDGVDAVEELRRVRDLQRRVTSGLQLLVYEVTSAAQVGAIFETLNERGRPLTELEKTKNYLLYLARLVPDARSNLLADRVNDGWAQIFRVLPSESAEEQLLRTHWLATQDPDVRHWKGVHSVKARFDRGRYLSAELRLIPRAGPQAPEEGAFAALVDDVDQYVTTLQHSAQILREILPPLETDAFSVFGHDAEEAGRATAALQRSGVIAVFLPLLVAARLRYPTDGDFYIRLVRTCEAYSARVFLIARYRINAGQARLYSLAYRLFTGEGPDSVLGELQSLLWSYAPDSRVKELLVDVNENWYWRSGHKYFLYEYERSLMAPGEEILPLSAFTQAGSERRTTEHILPQGPRDCWWEHFTPAEHEALRDSLGNLVLTLDNSSYSNKCFEDKRGRLPSLGERPWPCYAQGKLHQERQLASVQHWTPETIRQRQDELAAFALSRWPVEAPEGAPSETTADLDESELLPEDAELLTDVVDDDF